MGEVILTGFSSFLDWRLLTCRGPLPRASVCDVCSIVSQTSTVTGCLHAFCLSCYRSILTEECVKCPIDKTDIICNETRQYALRGDQQELLLVRCLNAEHGCNFEGPVSELEHHYLNDCSFHVLSCKTCKGPVPHHKILEHMKSCMVQEEGAPDLKEEPEQSNDNLRVAMPIASVVRGRHDKVNPLIELVQECIQSISNLKDKVKDVAESVQPCECAKAADDVRFVELVEQQSQAVQNYEDLVTTVTSMRNSSVAETFQLKPASVPDCWLAAGCRANCLSIQKHFFFCRNLSAKFTRARWCSEASPDLYSMASPRGKVIIKGCEVELCQAFCSSHFSFKLVVTKGENAPVLLDLSLTVVHPTCADKNKLCVLTLRDLDTEEKCIMEFYILKSEVDFVADDMVLVCLEAID